METNRPSHLASIACLAAWIGLSLVGVLVLTRLRGALLVIAVLLGMEGYGLGSLDKFSLVILGLLWIVGVAVLEGYLKAGLDKGRLKGRVVRVLVIEIILLGFAYLVQLLGR